MARGLRGIWSFVVKHGKTILSAITRSAKTAAKYISTKLRSVKAIVARKRLSPAKAKKLALAASF